MANSTLKAQLARLGQVRDVDRVLSGSPVDLVLQKAKAKPEAVTAALALAKRGLSLLRAKRAVEAMLVEGRAEIHVPTVENSSKLIAELEAAGIAAREQASDAVDVKALRERLGLSQSQFARRFNLALDAVQNWERGARKPDRAANSYLRVIALAPDVAAKAQEVGTEVGVE